MKSPISLFAPALLCFSGMFSFKSNFGALFSCLKMEKFLQSKQGLGGWGAGAVSGHSVRFGTGVE